MNRIAPNLARLRDSIETVARSAQRDPDEIKLLAVSKTHPIELLEAALHAGQDTFGESIVQEALPKIAHFAKREPTSRNAPTNQMVPEWHFIGHLQSNKVKFVPGNFAWIHSIDNLKLAQQLSRFANQRRAVLNALIEVNVSQDPRKHGVAPQVVTPFLERLLRENLSGIVLRGFMTIGPHPAKELDIRRAYAELRELRDDCARRFGLQAFDQLSMGMSGDYIQAIQEGATLLRIGTAIFGARDYGGARRRAAR